MSVKRILAGAGTLALAAGLFTGLGAVAASAAPVASVQAAGHYVRGHEVRWYAPGYSYWVPGTPGHYIWIAPAGEWVWVPGTAAYNIWESLADGQTVFVPATAYGAGYYWPVGPSMLWTWTPVVSDQYFEVPFGSLGGGYWFPVPAEPGHWTWGTSQGYYRWISGTGYWVHVPGYWHYRWVPGHWVR